MEEKFQPTNRTEKTVNAVVKQDASGIPALQMTEGELVNVLATSLYPGAQVTSIKMAIGYCKATGLDPMQKPVHIVPMWDSKAGQMRDVIMPGIGLYRTQASRSQQMAGISEPEFGPMVETQIGGQDVTYPEWCRVTVKRLLPSGAVAEFTAVEYWMENYAVKGGQQKSIAPNAMWSKRPRGQLAKCAEAQALRKAFPEIGAQPTADEMDGKAMDDGIVIDGATGEITGQRKQESKAPPELPPYPGDKFTANLPAWLDVIAQGRKTADQIIGHIKTRNTLSPEQEQQIRAGKPRADEPAFSAEEVASKLAAAQTVDDLDTAAALIAALPDTAHAALNARYDELRAQLTQE